MAFDVNETIELLLSNPARSQLALLYEREIRLSQFQTWIYFPEPSMDMVRLAGSLAAAKCLSRRERELLSSNAFGERAAASTELELFLKDPIYRKLFDETVKEYGTWTDLLLFLEESDFGGELIRRVKTAETVWRMIDYRFRYLDHGGTDRQQANITHSEFFRWKSKPSRSWKTIRERWSKNKLSAVFLYVSEGLGLRLSPNFDGVGYYSREVLMDATNITHIRRFFGTCAYVGEKLRGADGIGIDSDGKVISIPKTVVRVRPNTEPLSPSELEKMQSYSSGELKKMRAS